MDMDITGDSGKARELIAEVQAAINAMHGKQVTVIVRRPPSDPATPCRST